MEQDLIYPKVEPARSEIDSLAGATLLELGTPWCGYCQAAQPLIQAELAAHPGVRHVKIEDGKGRRLGRSYQVQLWPTLIFLEAGNEVSRLIRPTDVREIRAALDRIAPS